MRCTSSNIGHTIDTKGDFPRVRITFASHLGDFPPTVFLHGTKTFSATRKGLVARFDRLKVTIGRVGHDGIIGTLALVARRSSCFVTGRSHTHARTAQAGGIVGKTKFPLVLVGRFGRTGTFPEVHIKDLRSLTHDRIDRTIGEEINFLAILTFAQDSSIFQIPTFGQ